MATLDITRSIDIKAPRTKVWAALTEPDLIAQWFGDTAEFDPTPGAAGVLGWKDYGRFRVQVEHVDKPKTLVYRWARDVRRRSSAGNSTVVRFDLAEIDGGTRLSVLETGFEELRDPQAAHEALLKKKKKKKPLVEFLGGAERTAVTDRPRDVPAVLAVLARRDPLADPHRNRRCRSIRKCVGRPAARQPPGHRQTPDRAG